ncbi:lipopolysaccharide biosynthesis protein [Sphingomonas sp. VNH70]|uniref:lipopolysaccharide biosynthesis protein n=1 Tax=Sphingomonas silueang TaxID=3156617 RepID=UPI0032B57739
MTLPGGSGEPAAIEPVAQPAAEGVGATFGGSLASVAMRSLFWSLVQNWGGRMLNFLQFVLLAQLLSPREFGLAAAAAIITLFITLVAEFGFGDAIIQRADLKDRDVNLPFFFALGISVTLALLAIAGADLFERWLKVEGLAPVVRALSLIAPITTVSQFQEAVYKRHLAFKPLAVRVLVANLVATFVSVPCAYLGFGVWSLVIQAYLVAILGAAWIWYRPRWRPTRAIDLSSALGLGRFGVFVLAMRLLDFGATRLVEVLMIGRHGVRAYGFYTASGKLNQTLMDLLQSALNDVSLSLLSKISQQRERLASVYRLSIAIAGNVAPPVFVAIAALSPEVCGTLFNARWAGIERIAALLFLLGAVQSLQFLSRPYLNARGRSEAVLVISILKFAIVIATLLVAPSDSIYTLVLWYVLAQLASAPISFFVTSRELGLPFWQVYVDLAPVALSCALAFLAVGIARQHVAALVAGPPVVNGIVLGVVFVAAYGVVIALTGRRQLGVVVDFARTRLRNRKHA